jgi:hypothetical protein
MAEMLAMQEQLPVNVSADRANDSTRTYWLAEAPGTAA